MQEFILFSKSAIWRSNYKLIAFLRYFFFNFLRRTMRLTLQIRKERKKKVEEQGREVFMKSVRQYLSLSIPKSFFFIQSWKRWNMKYKNSPENTWFERCGNCIKILYLNRRQGQSNLRDRFNSSMYSIDCFFSSRHHLWH